MHAFLIAISACLLNFIFGVRVTRVILLADLILIFLNFAHHFSRFARVLDNLNSRKGLLEANIHIPRSSANCDMLTWLLAGSMGMSFTKIKKSRGLRTEP